MLDEDVIVGGKYLMGRKIGSGSFGSILLGTDIETAKFVAIKFVYHLFYVLIISCRKSHHYLNIRSFFTRQKS